MLLKMTKKDEDLIDQKDFIVTEGQLHAIEVKKFICCQGRLVTKEEASQLVTVWGDKVGEGYKASEIAANLQISQRKLKKWIQNQEIKESIKIKIKKLVFTVYLVRFFRDGMELFYILRLFMKKENFAYHNDRDAPVSPEKLMIIAPGCSGKSTFSAKKEYCGYALYDDMSRTWDRTKGDYEEFRLSFLRNHSGKVCALDPFYRIRLFDNIHIAVVMPPKKNHLRNYKVRRKITGTFSMKQILNWRKEILQFSLENNLQIFPDFETALIQFSKHDKT